MSKKATLVPLIIVSFVILACGLPFGLGKTPRGSIGDIVFCEDVTDKGKCLNPGKHFGSDTQTVWAYFTYKDMENGQKWDRLWEHEGKVYSETRNETWQDGSEGWLAYNITEETGLSGLYSLTISIDGREAKKAGFQVDPPSADNQTTTPAFGPITFAEGTEGNIPIKPANSFNQGLMKLYAIFAYKNMEDGTSWACEWQRDGQTLAKAGSQWDAGTTDGIHVCTFHDSNDVPLAAGTYTLNLFIGSQIARSGSAVIETNLTPETGEQPTPPAPEDLVDPELLPAFNTLLESPLPVLNAIAQTALDHHVQIMVANECQPDAASCFSYTCDDRQIGVIYIMPDTLNKSADLIASDLAYELTHAQEHFAGMKCGCTVEKEYFAAATQVEFLLYGGFNDYVTENFGAIFDDNGKVDPNLLWDKVKESYSQCLEY
jgi:hypothetical protein